MKRERERDGGREREGGRERKEGERECVGMQVLARESWLSLVHIAPRCEFEKEAPIWARCLILL